MLFANINLGGLENYSHSGSAGLGRGRREPHGDPLHADQGDSGRWSYDVRWQTNGFQDKYTKYTTTPTKKPFITIHFIYVWGWKDHMPWYFLHFPKQLPCHRGEDPAFRLKAAGPRHQDGGLAAASFGWRLEEDFSNLCKKMNTIRYEVSKNKSWTQPSQMIL